MLLRTYVCSAQNLHCACHHNCLTGRWGTTGSFTATLVGTNGKVIGQYGEHHVACMFPCHSVYIPKLTRMSYHQGKVQQRRKGLLVGSNPLPVTTFRARQQRKRRRHGQRDLQCARSSWQLRHSCSNMGKYKRWTRQRQPASSLHAHGQEHRCYQSEQRCANLPPGYCCCLNLHV